MEGLSAQMFQSATVTYGVSMATVFTVLVATWVAGHWERVRTLWYGLPFRRVPYDLHAIFHEFFNIVNETPDRRALYHALLRFLGRSANVEELSLLLRNGDPNRYLLKESIGAKPSSFQVGEIQSFLNWIKQNGQVITRGEILSNPKYSNIKSLGLQYCVQFHAEAIMPLFLGGRMLGVVNLGPRKKGKSFHPPLLKLLSLLTGHLAMAINNANLFEGVVVQNAKLREMGQLKNQLLANISHEIRTPLNSIIGIADLMLDDEGAKVSEQCKDHVLNLKESGLRLLNTLSTMVDLAKLESNRLSLDVKRINMQRIIRSVCESVPVDNRIQLFIDIDSTMPPVYGDEAWIIRLMKHLMINAFKFTSEGEVHVRAQRMGEMLRIEVSDTGIGIPKERQRVIFDHFTQAENGMERPYEGLGLGLSISRKIVQLHGGRIWVESEVSKGSRFYFTLPLKPTNIQSLELAS